MQPSAGTRTFLSRIARRTRARRPMSQLSKMRQSSTTRAKGQADALTSRLKALGADVVEMPTIEIRPAADYGPLDRALSDLASYDWLIFTSANGVRFFLERLDASALDLRALH